MTRVLPITLALLLAAAASQARAAAPVVTVDQATIEPAGISGYPGSASDTRQPGGDALLYAIGGGERGDNPCYLELGWSRQNATEQRLFETRFWQPPCADEHHSYQQVALHYPSPSGGIAEIDVCNSNKDDHRLKAVKITLARDITETGNHDWPNTAVDGRFERANCATWLHPSRCATNKVAVGITVHYGDEGMTGLQLICATATIPPKPTPPVPPFKIDTSSSTTTDVSGFGGTPVRVGAPVTAGFAVGSLDSFEQRDNPCKLTVGSDAVREPLVHTWTSDMLRYDEADRCNGSPGDMIRVELGFPLSFIDAHKDDLWQAFASGVRICTSNDGTRLKGFEIKGRTVMVEGPGIVIEDAVLDTDKSRSFRPHCNAGNWKRWVECPGQKVATAILAYFEAGAPPRSVTGLALECSSIVTGS